MPTTSTAFGAFVDSEFKKGYILDEERIRKLNEILLTRAVLIDPGCRPVFKIYKADTFSYTTDDLQKILSENNADWEKIERLTIFMEHKDDFQLNLDFGAEITKLHIEGKDRDTVFLIFSELKQYIGNEIAIIKPVFNNKAKSITKAIVYIIVTVTMLIFAVTTLSPESSASTNPISKLEALESPDITTKLDFLIERQRDAELSGFSRYISFLAFAPLILLMLVTVGGELFVRPMKHLFPDRVFLIGKEIEKHNKRLSLRQNLLWVGIIGFLISILSGLLVWFITQ